MKYRTYTILLALSLSFFTNSCVLPNNTRRDKSNDHKIMVHNFLNILIEGAKAITSDNPQTQLESISKAFESIVNISGLAYRSQRCIYNDDFMRELTHYRNDFLHEMESILL